MPLSQEADDFGGGWKVYDNRFELLRAQRILPDRFDKNMAWALLELDAEPQTKREAELVARYREQVQRELLLAIARGVSMDDVLMEDDEGEGGFAGRSARRAAGGAPDENSDSTHLHHAGPRNVLGWQPTAETRRAVAA